MNEVTARPLVLLMYKVIWELLIINRLADLLVVIINDGLFPAHILPCC